MRSILSFLFSKNLLKGLIYFQLIFLFNSIAYSQTYCEDIIGSNCDSCPSYKVAINPDLSVSCEISINAILLIDESNSIGNSNAEQDVQDGVSAFLQELECSTVNVAIIEFGSAANYIVPTYTPVSSVIDGMDDYFNGIPYNGQTYNPNQGVFGATNWQAGFLQANLLPPADLLLMLTDGVPTAYTPDANFPNSSFDFCGSGNSTQEAELYNAVQVANMIKSEGTHIFILGVGAVNADLLVDISGSDQYGAGNTIATADYFIDQGFGTLAQCFASLANSLCPLVEEINGSTICEGDSNGSITINMAAEATAPFFITINDNEPIVTSNYNEIITGLEVGSYNVHVEGSGSCYGTGNFVVDILAYPLPVLSVENISICQGKKSSINLDTLITSDGIVSYYLTQVDAENGTNPLFGANVNPSETTTYYIRSVSTENNCFVIDSITVFVEELPTCVVSDAHINCYNENGIAQLLVETNAVNASYEWSTLDGNIVSGETTDTPEVNQPGIYSVLVTNLDTGCSNTCNVTVTQDITQPVVHIEYVDTLCSRHEAIQLVATPFGGEFSGDLVTSDGVFEAYNAGVYTVSYSFTNPENGCEGIASIDIEVVDCCSDETAFAYNNELATCFPGVRRDTNETIFSQDTNTLNRSARWGWSNGALDFDTDYTFQLIAGAGRCRISNGEIVGEVTISYNENGDMIVNYTLNEPFNNMYYQLGGVHVYIGCNQFPERLAPGQMPYHSSADSELSAGLVIPVEDLEALDCEEFYFIAHAEVNVCSTEMMNRGEDIVKDDESSVLIYPIPFRDYVHVKLNFTYDTNVVIELLDMSGNLKQRLNNFTYQKGENNNQVTLNMSKYNDKMYFVRVITGKETIVKKIVPSN